MYSILLQTTHGDAAFSFALSPEGRVFDIACTSLDLPPALLKMTYPNADPAELQREFGAWRQLLPWLVETALWMTETPDYLHAVVAAFREQHPDYEQARRRVTDIDPLDVADGTPAHWVRTSALLRLGFARPVTHFPTTRRGKRAIFAADKMSLPYRRIAADWLTSAFPLAGAFHTSEWLTALGKTRTTEANDYLFRQLERSGTLPYAKQAFSVLANSRLKPDADRIVALYEDRDTIFGNVAPYVHLLNKLPIPRARPLLQRIVDDYPLEALPALRRLNRHDRALTQGTLYAMFTTSSGYSPTVLALKYAIDLYGNEQELFTLMDVNERLNDADFLDDEQVTWPQKLATGWEIILLRSSPAEVREVAVRYLPGAHGRVARNILLQLRVYLQGHPDVNLELPYDVEAPLIGMLNARHDKVSTVATDVLRLVFPYLHDKATANQALLNHFVVSRYRLMDAAALKVAAREEGLAAAQQNFLADLIMQAGSKERLEELKKWVTYLRFLPEVEGLGKMVEDRMKTFAG